MTHPNFVLEDDYCVLSCLLSLLFLLHLLQAHLLRYFVLILVSFCRTGKGGGVYRFCTWLVLNYSLNIQFCDLNLGKVKHLKTLVWLEVHRHLVHLEIH